jgi:hypothetical protein
MLVNQRGLMNYSECIDFSIRNMSIISNTHFTDKSGLRENPTEIPLKSQKKPRYEKEDRKASNQLINSISLLENK